jgi:hypothetical protein
LINRLNDVERDIAELQSVLVKRKERESGVDLSQLEFRLRQASNYASTTLFFAVKGNKSHKLEEF